MPEFCSRVNSFRQNTKGKEYFNFAREMTCASNRINPHLDKILNSYVKLFIITLIEIFECLLQNVKKLLWKFQLLIFLLHELGKYILAPKLFGFTKKFTKGNNLILLSEWLALMAHSFWALHPILKREMNPPLKWSFVWKWCYYVPFFSHYD